MATVWITGEDRKKLMKRNIIKHRREVLGYLELLHNTDLKPRVNSHKNDLLELDLFSSSAPKPDSLPLSAVLGSMKEEFRVKKELYERDISNDSSDLSVGSVERWNGVCQTPDFRTFKEPSINENSKSNVNRTQYYDSLKARCKYIPVWIFNDKY